MIVKNKKKILIVTDFYKPHISGITTYIRSLTNVLTKNNYQDLTAKSESLSLIIGSNIN